MSHLKVNQRSKVIPFKSLTNLFIILINCTIEFSVSFNLIIKDLFFKYVSLFYQLSIHTKRVKLVAWQGHGVI